MLLRECNYCSNLLALEHLLTSDTQWSNVWSPQLCWWFIVQCYYQMLFLCR